MTGRDLQPVSAREAFAELQRVRDRHHELCVGVPPELQTDGRFHLCITFVGLMLDLERES